MIFVPQYVEALPFEHTVIEQGQTPRIHATDAMISKVRKKMKDVGKGDFIYPSGNIVVNVIAGLVQSVNTEKLKIITDYKKTSMMLDLNVKFEKRGNTGTAPKVCVFDKELHNMRNAEDFGKIIQVFPDGISMTRKDLNKCFYATHAFVSPHDYIMISGPKWLNMAMTAMCMKRNGACRILIYDAKKKAYFLRDLEEEAFKIDR